MQLTSNLNNLLVEDTLVIFIISQLIIEARISVQSAQDFAKTHFEGAEGIFNWRDLSSRNFFFT
jgi:hypothetical protein